MQLEKERELIVEYGKKMLETGLTRGTGGNLSLYNRKAGLVAISPSGMDYKRITPRDVVLIDTDGQVREGERKPSTEHLMHLIFYSRSEEIGAIFHTHSPFACSVAALNQSIPAASYLMGFCGVEVPCAEYALFASPELAENAYRAMGENRAVLLANHGVLAVGEDLDQAFTTAEMVEFSAEIYCRAKSMGEPVIIPPAEMERNIRRFEAHS